MDEIKVEQFIYCTKTRRGDGSGYPVRIITEIYTLNGDLVAERDCESYTIEEIYKAFRASGIVTDNYYDFESILRAR